MTRVLLLAGTREARLLARHLADDPGIELTASLAGATEEPAALPCVTRSGGFGGAAGLASYLVAHDISLLIDATHPYAEQMQANAVDASVKAGISRLRLLRPPWPTRAGWQNAATLTEAARLLPKGAKALLTTGRKEIAPFAARPDCQFILRTIDPVPELPPHISPLQARPPFTADSERALFALLGLTHLVTKNAGGTGTAKLDVADEMRLTTIVAARPAEPEGPIARTVEAAVAWVRDSVANE